MMSMLMKVMLPRKRRSDLLGQVASLFSPFWCLDAKGGEAVLSRLLRDLLWVGHKQKLNLYSLLCRLCPFISC